MIIANQILLKEILLEHQTIQAVLANILKSSDYISLNANDFFYKNDVDSFEIDMADFDWAFPILMKYPNQGLHALMSFIAQQEPIQKWVAAEFRAALAAFESLENITVHSRKLLSVSHTINPIYSVKEKLPQVEYGSFLVFAPISFPKNSRWLVAEYYDDAKGFYSESSEMFLEDVTHWCELPKEPTNE